MALEQRAGEFCGFSSSGSGETVPSKGASDSGSAWSWWVRLMGRMEQLQPPNCLEKHQ